MAENSNVQAALPRFPWADFPADRTYVDNAIADLKADIANSPSASAGASGVGSPEGVVTASPGATYWDTAGQFFYVKDSGTGNTGWAIH